MHIMKHVLGVMLMSTALGACSMENSENKNGGEGAVLKEVLPVNAQQNRLAIGSSVVVGLKEDGTLWSWGSGTNGALGNGKTNVLQLTPSPIPGMTDFLEVSGRMSHFLALRKDGTVWSWGNNRYGQLGYATNGDSSATPTQIKELQNIISVAAGVAHSLALDKDGNIYGFGKNESSKLGIDSGLVKNYQAPMLVKRVPGALRVIAGVSESALITTDGTAYLWGHNLLNKLSTSKVQEISEIGQHKIDDVREVAFGTMFTCLLMRDGSVICMGDNRAGQLGQGDFKKHPQKMLKVQGLPSIRKIATSGMSVVALDASGLVWEWGASVLGPPPRTDSALPIRAEGFPAGTSVVDIYNGFVSAAFAKNGHAFFWGADINGMRGTGKPSEPQSFISGKRQWTTPQQSLWKFK